MRSIYATASLALLWLLPIPVLGAEAIEGGAESARLFDDFDGKLALDWKQVRPDPTHQSLTRSPGKLTITTQYGSIHRTGRPQLARNMFLLDVPETEQDAFVVTTIVESFRPRMPYNQAGLLIYKDDDNYFKFVCQFSPVGAPIFTPLLEQNGVSVQAAVRVPFNLERLWLRVTRRGNLYECSSSDDGKTFTACADVAWDDSPRQVGLVAKNGGEQGAIEVDAHFDSFEFRPLTPEEKEDPGQSERLKLRGVWKVVSGRIGGKEMVNPAVTNITIRQGELVLQEKTRGVIASWVIDASSAPKVLTAYMRSGTKLTPLHWGYAVDGDKLTLCTILKPNAEPPDSLETKEGDDRMVLSLQRVKPEP